MTSTKRVGFSSKLGGLLAAAGSAIGLGNIWRFPTQCGENGGSAFLLVYFLIIISFGIPLLIAEFSIGRHSRANVGNAYSVLAPNTFWKFVGFGSVAVATTILCYYNVVVGWVLYYAWDSVTGTFNDLAAIQATAEAGKDVFTDHFVGFITNPWKPIIALFIVLAIIHGIIVCGVQKGIERSSKLLVPALFVIMVMLVIFAATMPGASDAYAFLFKPDFDAIKNPDVWLAALGQCFYSFSLGMGIVTYASYFRSEVNLTRTALSVAGLDTLVALMAGLIIFPAVFSVSGVEPSAGAGLVFISLPNVFHSALHTMPFFNWIIPSAFYLILLVAAITSCIFLHEVGTAFIAERANMSRKTAALVVTIGTFVIGVAASLSYGPWDVKVFFGMNFFDFLDFFTAQIILPLTGLGAALFVGYKMQRSQLIQELTSNGTHKFVLVGPFLILLKFIIPLLIIFIMITQLFGIKFG